MPAAGPGSGSSRLQEKSKSTRTPSTRVVPAIPLALGPKPKAQPKPPTPDAPKPNEAVSDQQKLIKAVDSAETTFEAVSSPQKLENASTPSPAAAQNGSLTPKAAANNPPVIEQQAENDPVEETDGTAQDQSTAQSPVSKPPVLIRDQQPKMPQRIRNLRPLSLRLAIAQTHYHHHSSHHLRPLNTLVLPQTRRHVSLMRRQAQ